MSHDDRPPDVKWKAYEHYVMNVQIHRQTGENVINAETILSAWLKYCRESRIYRILEFFRLK